MDGAIVKELLLSDGYQLVDIASKLNITPQDLQSKLRSKDLKTSFLVEISNAINKSVYYFLEKGDIKPEVGNNSIGWAIVDDEKRNVKKTPHFQNVAESVAKNVANQKLEKRHTFEGEEKTKSAKKVNKKNVDLNVDQNVTKPNVQKKSTNEEVSEIEKGVKLYKGKAIEESEGIPLIPIEAMAGFGSGEVQVMDYETSNYKVPEFTELKANFMIRVKGSSMYPKYSSGDLVACKKLYLSDIFFQWNKVYVLDTAQGAIIKRVKKGSDKEHLLLISENPNYDPFELHISQINAIALVVGVIRLE
ncbi:S24 family peptidase [Ornithobacterium rhinotracheale]|uniref:S24 family peptidase n=3 Tax=Ornithobacterium rhinotracheale TaxID=28251 RepID=UPI004035D0DF